jgi:hypothetical protein
MQQLHCKNPKNGQYITPFFRLIRIDVGGERQIKNKSKTNQATHQEDEFTPF